jgi:hypothetical protein
MLFLLLVIAGIVLVLNGSWFAGATLVGIILLAVGVVLTLWTLFVVRLATSIIKDVKEPGTPRFPRR